ncbi:MAG TPA: TRAP transporter small permease [Syntrophales bacterium]|nr:TRAP transporter small permease [Syntrophales bacterium]
MYRLERFATHLFEMIITFFFFVILSITITLVIMRYGFNAAIIGGNEAMNYLFIYTTALGAAISVGKKEHIKITFFIDKLKARPRKYVNILNYLLIGFINGVMIWYSPNWICSTGYFESPVLRIPNWIVQISVPVGCSLVILYCLNHIFLEIFNNKSSSSGEHI